MSTKHQTVCWGWLLVFVGTMVVAVANAADTQPTVSTMEKTFDQSCLAPYREELAGWQPAQLDREAYWRVVQAARAAAADSCSEFVKRIERNEQLGAREGKYLRDARALLTASPKGKCIEAWVVSEVVRSPHSLYEFSLCHSGKERSGLLREAVRMDPGHVGALLFLATGELDSQSRAGYGEELYQRSEDTDVKMDAARAIVDWAVDRGDPAAAREIHERFKRHLLNVPPLERCGEHLDSLGLEEVCLQAIESIATEALQANKVLPSRLVSQVSYQYWRTYRMIDLPDQVRSESEVAEMLAPPGARAQLVADHSDALEYLEIDGNDDVEFAKFLRGAPHRTELLDHDAFLTEALDLEPWKIRKTAQVKRLKAVLENYPESLRTAEHQLKLAVMVSTWGERIALLQDAVKVEPNHVLARCELAEALAATGDLFGARRGYQSLLADDDGSCNAQARLGALDDRPPTEAVSLDEPHNVIVRH